MRRTRLRALASYPASDPGWEGIVEALEAADGLVVRRNVDNDVYLGLMASADALVGNSSAALVEAPYLSLPAVNVGDRQLGRDRDPNVIDVEPDADSIVAAIERARSEDFRRSLRPTNRLGDGRASDRIVEVLKTVELDRRLLEKTIAY